VHLIAGFYAGGSNGNVAPTTILLLSRRQAAKQRRTNRLHQRLEHRSRWAPADRYQPVAMTDL